MIAFGTCVGGSGEKYQDVALHGLERCAGPEDIILSASGDSICKVYNEFIETALSNDDCEALVLLHDDVEIIDPNFRATVTAAIREPHVGVVGVAGGAGLTSPAWWESTRTAGLVWESGGVNSFGVRRADVQIVDGLLLVLTRAAMEAVQFDADNFPAFHGYDADYCIRIIKSGLRVIVRDIEVIHRTKGNLGDTAAFADFKTSFRALHGDLITSPGANAHLISATRGLIGDAKRARGRARALARRLLRHEQTETLTAPSWSGIVPDSCGLCGSDLGEPPVRELPFHMKCPQCATISTAPVPSRDIRGEGIWEDSYDGARIAGRDGWFHEADMRLTWMMNYISDGTLIEVGAATGEFCVAGDRAGFLTHGIEVSEWAAAQACELGATVFAGTLDEWRSQNPDYYADAVASWHVIEHVPQINEFLASMHSILRPDGYLFLETPNGESSECKRLGPEWPDAAPKEHVYLFNAKALDDALHRAGFKQVNVFQLSRRMYSDPKEWLTHKNSALLARRPWPSLDFLRVVARP